MNRSHLIAYATKHGSTREVAEQIGDVLREHGCRVEVRPAADVKDLAGFDGVVLGGSLYMGRWHADARRFLKHYRSQLATMPLAVFALGPLKMEPKDVEGSRKQLEHALAATPELAPVAVEIFGGVVDPAKLHFPFSHMPDTDARDPAEIVAWTEQIAGLLEPATIS